MSDDGPSSGAGADPSGDLARAQAQLGATARRLLGEERWAAARPLVDLPLLLLFVAAMTVLLVRVLPDRVDVPAVDAIADSTVRAERDLLVQDRRATELRRSEAAASVPQVFDHDSELYFAMAERIYAAVGQLERRLAEANAAQDVRRAAFERDLGLTVEPAHFAEIERLAEPADLAVALNFFLNLTLDRLIVADQAVLPRGEAMLVRDRRQNRESLLEHTGNVMELRQLQRLIAVRAGDAPYGSARHLRGWIAEAARSLVRPNLSPNPAATQEARKAALEAVEPVFVRIRSGEVLVRRGDRVTAPAHERIRLMNEATEARAPWREGLSAALLVGGVALLGLLAFHRPPAARQRRRSAYVTLTALLLGTATALIVYYAARGVADGLGVEAEGTVYATPLALAAMLTVLLVELRVALAAGMLLAMFFSQRLDGGLEMALVFAVGALVAAIAGQRCRSRNDVLRAGIAIGIAQAATVPLALSFVGTAFGTGYLPHMLAAFLSGPVAAALALVLLPVLEHLFDEATDLRLIELAASDSPLLKRLAMVAPGSYYASIVVGNLAEAAAEAIGCNPTRARVMALYHDIGKLTRPSYFSENQSEGNVHDRLPPEVSARIVFGHVADGLELARRHRLPRVILEGIATHQGTGLLRSFYVKAIERARNGGQAPAEALFRYPGPLPQSREACVVMLADAVEAGCRALRQRGPVELRQRVAELLEERAADGQLDASALTLAELSAVREAFLRVLTLGVYHTRIEYPPLPAPGTARTEPHADRRRLGYLGRLVDRAP